MPKRTNARKNILDRWLACRACRLQQYRRQVVLGRGVIPAPLLFIGEAPGKSEDLRGEAFIGPSGRLLNRAMQDAAEMVGCPIPTFYVTNVIACRPCDVKSGPNRQPLPDEIICCRPRLADTVALVKPEVVVLLGKVAETEAKAVCPDGIGLYHPAYIIRRGGTQSVDYRAFVRGLSSVFERIG